MSLKNSRYLALGALAFLIGLAIGSQITFNLVTLSWVTGLWIIVAISGLEKPYNYYATIFSWLLIGICFWQITEGEAYLKLPFIEHVSKLLISWRDKVIDRFFLVLPEPHGSLLSGIIFGNRLKLDRDLVETFRIVGLSHIIAVSGHNLSILTANVNSIFRPIMGNRSIWVSFTVIVCFIIVTGAPSSILRSGVMAASILIASALGRPNQAVNIIILTAAILALFSPKIIFEIGFQLSIAATYGLIRLAPSITYAIRKWPLPNLTKTIISETLSATLLTAPIIIFYFERISLVSPLSNLVVLPLIPALMALGLIGALTILIIPPLGSYLALLSWPILEWITLVGTYLARLPHASTSLTWPSTVVIISIFTLIALTEWAYWLFKKREGNLVERYAAGN